MIKFQNTNNSPQPPLIVRGGAGALKKLLKFIRNYITGRRDSSVFSKTREIRAPESREMNFKKGRINPSPFDKAQGTPFTKGRINSSFLKGGGLRSKTEDLIRFWVPDLIRINNQKTASFNVVSNLGTSFPSGSNLTGFFNESKHQNSEYHYKNNESPEAIYNIDDLGIHKLFSLFRNYNHNSYEQEHRDDSSQIVISQNVAHFSFDKYTAKNNDNKPNISPLIISKESAAEKAGIVNDGTTTTAISHAVAKLTRNSDSVFNWDLSNIYNDYNSYKSDVNMSIIYLQ
mgnify:CR=1 FL=1